MSAEELEIKEVSFLGFSMRTSGPCGGRHCIGDDDSASEVSGLRGCQMYIVRSLWTDVFRRWIYCHTSQEQSMKSAGGGEGSQNRCQCTTTAMALSLRCNLLKQAQPSRAPDLGRSLAV